VAVIGRHMDLKRSGRTWKGNCVFHGEKTPSFHVYPEDKHFKCYGCGEYGDVFKFLQKLSGKEFPEVVRELAAEVGVEIPDVEEESAEARERRRERNEILTACDAAARYWAARLWSDHGRSAREYLAARGIGEEVTKAFRIGVAADAWNDLPRRLASKNVGDDAIRRAGFLVEKDGRTYDRFRNRLMFPISGMDKQVIGFGARALGEEKGAKYINTPETPLYKKSRVLYGLDLAREEIRRSRRAILVEGYFDVIGLHQAGVKNAVAVCGTALTPEHVELLERCDCREVVLLFDGDAAGAAAPAKVAPAVLPSPIVAKVALLPMDAGKVDPDEFVRANGRSALEALIAKAVPVTEFLIAGAARQVGVGGSGTLKDAALEQKLEAVRTLQPFVAAIEDQLARSIFIERIARELDVNEDRLWEVLEPRRAAVAPVAPSARGAVRPRVPIAASGARERVRLATPAIDALALLATYADALGATAEGENFALLLPEGVLADMARSLYGGPKPPAELLALARSVLDAASFTRFEALMGPASPGRDAADREFLKATVKARLLRLDGEMDKTSGLIARAGTPAPEDLTTRQLRQLNQRRDLEKRLRSLEPG
jgi:DNA primase